MSKTDIWMPLYIGDYLADTMHLTTEQHGAYLLLLMHYWRAGSLPADDRGRAQIARCSEHAWSIARPVLEEFFTVCSDGRWKHKRIEEMLSDVKEKSARNQERARKAAESRWRNNDLEIGDAKSNAPSNATSIPKAMPEQCSDDASQKLEVRSQKLDTESEPESEKPMSRDRDDVLSIFDHWREVMNHPRAKLDDKRRKLIRKALGLGYSLEDLQQAITGYSLSPFHMGQNDDGRRYDGLELILRNADKIDAGVEFYNNPPRMKGRQARTEAINQQAIDDFVNGPDPFNPDEDWGEALEGTYEYAQG